MAHVGAQWHPRPSSLAHSTGRGARAEGAAASSAAGRRASRSRAAGRGASASEPAGCWASHERCRVLQHFFGEECRHELAEHAPTSFRPRTSVERLQLQNQELAEELEDLERQSRELSSRESFLRNEVAEAHHLEEEEAARWHQEERCLRQELQDAQQQESSLLKALQQKARSVNERNQKLREELRVEEEKTQQKTLALEAEVRRLKAELWTGSFGSRGLSPSRSEASEVWNGTESSSGSSLSSRRQSFERRRRKTCTSSFKPLQEVVKEDGKQKGVDTELDSAVTALRSSVLGVMDDALLKVGELFQSDSRPADCGVCGYSGCLLVDPGVCGCSGCPGVCGADPGVCGYSGCLW
ncbi:unnamed protein product [Effrenium voratum]|nr:unnamed protein product [Effrenium voratum]